jgi:hypothetical protein
MTPKLKKNKKNKKTLNLNKRQLSRLITLADGIAQVVGEII